MSDTSHVSYTRNARTAHAFQARTLRYAHVTGWGMEVPPRIMRNDDFKPLVGVDDAWIFPRTGIHERRIAAEGETTTDLAVRAAQKALRVANVLPSEVDFIIVATSTPEYIFPSTASIVQDRLGAVNAGAGDVSAACAGFVYALDLAVNKVRTGSINTALVIGAETMSRVLDWNDRKTCVLFGDGAGALVVRGSDQPGGVLTTYTRSDGSGWDLLTLPTVNSRETYLRDGLHQMHTLYMDGKCVFQFAKDALAGGVTTALAQVGLEPGDLDLLIPHQANQRIIDIAIDSLGIAPEIAYSNLSRYGNTSAASIPIALTEAIEAGRVQPGDLVALVGFGGGLAWGAAVIEWGAPQGAVAPVLASVLRQPQAVTERTWANARRWYQRTVWRWMVHHSPRATLRRWRRSWSQRARQTLSGTARAVPTMSTPERSAESTVTAPAHTASR